MATNNSARHIIWRFSDGRAGHDHQSQGLIRAMAGYVPIESHDLCVMKLLPGMFNYLRKTTPPGETLPNPELVIGAGHGTHLSVLCAKRSHRAKTVVLMRPSLPVSRFDFCLIPEHDKPENSENIIVTRGALNLMTPSSRHQDGNGIIMIGGPSRHFTWDTSGILKQLQAISRNTSHIFWQITDSPRTPDETRSALQQLGLENVVYRPCKETPPGWLAEQLQGCGQSWVTADSISMVYESLTTGVPTGVLLVPEKKPNKISHAIDALNQEHMITLYNNWCSDKPLSPPSKILHEADRCAKILLNKLQWI